MGTTQSSGLAYLRNGDHPRVCGYNAINKTSLQSVSGSPPRMRVQQSLTVGYYMRTRITPAYAGTTCIYPYCIWWWRDHTRACGYNEQTDASQWVTTGSPPRLRVQQTAPQQPVQDPGITPALAGTTLL